MLGTVGFGAATLVFLAYGLTAHKYATKEASFQLKTYSLAFIITALACAVWAVGTRLDSALESFVLVGDALLLVASILLVRNVSPPKQTNLYTSLVVGLSVCSLIYRAVSGGQGPIMRDGILVFYTPRIFGVFLITLLLAVWVRANMKFYAQVIRPTIKGVSLQSSYFAANMLGAIGVSGFLFARKPVTIVISFSMLVLAYLTLSALNYVALKPDAKGVVDAK